MNRIAGFSVEFRLQIRASAGYRFSTVHAVMPMLLVVLAACGQTSGEGLLPASPSLSSQRAQPSIPPYPNATAAVVTSSGRAFEGDTEITSFRTGDPVDTVVDFYSRELLAAGWTEYRQQPLYHPNRPNLSWQRGFVYLGRCPVYGIALYASADGQVTQVELDLTRSPCK